MPLFRMVHSFRQVEWSKAGGGDSHETRQHYADHAFSEVTPSHHRTTPFCSDRFCQFPTFDVPTLSFKRINFGVTFPSVIVSSPTPRGRENRLGPAEPGLKSGVLPNHSVLG